MGYATTESPQAVRVDSGGHSDLTDVAQTLRAALADYLAGRAGGCQQSAGRDAALAVLRERGRQRVLCDLDANLVSLRHLYAAVAEANDLHDYDLPVERDLLDRLLRLRDETRCTDPYGAGAVEESCWILVQQFYCDAVDCAHRLLAREQGHIPPAGKYDEAGRVRRFAVMGISARSRLQAALNAIEVAVPNPIEMRLSRTMLPTLLHMMRHQLIPWGELRWHEFERTTLSWLAPQGFARLRGMIDARAAGRRQANPVECRVRVLGREYLQDNAELFDAGSGRMRHNVVIAASHRLGFLDFPLFAEALRGVPHMVWANNAFYTPGMARKLARSRTAIPIRGVGRMAFRDAIDLTIRVMSEDGLPLFLMSDGATKNLLYGQYLRVKRGVRVLVDECARRSRGTSRRTFVVPMTFDDPIAYLLGWENEIRVGLHPPIEITEPTSSDAHTSLFDESRINGGDPLLNQLEAIYFVHSLQARIGLNGPDVVAAARVWLHERHPGMRGWLRRRWNMSVLDLCRIGAVRARELGSQIAPYDAV